MPKYPKPFVQDQLDVLFDRGAQEPAAPATAFAMSDRSTDGSAGAKEEEIDMGVYLDRMLAAKRQRRGIEMGHT